MENTTIQKNTGTTDAPVWTDTAYKYKTVIKVPQVVMTSVTSEQSGSDAKQIELEGQIEESGSESFIEAIVTTDLAELHIDNTATSP